jgi:hypothetical protein
LTIGVAAGAADDHDGPASKYISLRKYILVWVQCISTYRYPSTALMYCAATN